MLRGEVRPLLPLATGIHLLECMEEKIIGFLTSHMLLMFAFAMYILTSLFGQGNYQKGSVTASWMISLGMALPPCDRARL